MVKTGFSGWAFKVVSMTKLPGTDSKPTKCFDMVFGTVMSMSDKQNLVTFLVN